MNIIKQCRIIGAPVVRTIIKHVKYVTIALGQKGELMKLIDADVALEALIEKGQASRRYKLGEIWELNGQEIREALNTIPSAQKKGHWINGGTNYCCSECHRGCWVNSNYCPWCGADMRGEKND